MFRNILITLAGFALVAACIFGVGVLIEPTSSFAPITAESPCPAVGCASGTCHGFDDVPEPDGIHEMSCPEATCASVECHAYESLVTRYHQASDASLNLWILAPVALIVALVLIVRKVR